ncbi:hypothetical protein BBP40_005247 [Aspergillus hancockii]|nr:hypothetical protein BBP40_005247 [Aspergillus hancockii]
MNDPPGFQIKTPVPEDKDHEWGFLRQLSSDPNNNVIGLVRDKSATEKKVSEELQGPSNIAVAGTAKLTSAGLDYLIANAAFVSHFDAYDPIGVLAQQPEALEANLMKCFKVNVVGNINLFNLSMPLIRKGDVKKVIAISSSQAALDMIPKLKIEAASLYAISKAGLNTAVAKFSEYAPHFKGASTVDATTNDVTSVMNKASVKNGDGGSFVSHYGNQQWL